MSGRGRVGSVFQASEHLLLELSREMCMKASKGAGTYWINCVSAELITVFRITSTHKCIEGSVYPNSDSTGF